MPWAPLIQADSLAHFAANPVGLYVRDTHFLYFCQSEQLYGCSLWGRPNGPEAKRFIEALRVEVRPSAQPHLAFMDFSGLTWVDSEAFMLMREFIDEVEARQIEVTQKEAIIRPAGVAGAVVAGFFAIKPPPYPSKTFATGEEAALWLGIEPELMRAWARLRESLEGVPAELAQLRHVLAAHYRVADVAFAADRLNCSARTLQRRLKQWRTGFQQELDAVRLEQATARLTGTDEKLASVAADIGFSSAQHFSEWFRAQTGVTPDSMRKPKP